MTQIVFVGTGEACDPELPNTSILLEGSKNLLLDCGYSVPQALWRVVSDASALDAVFLSHVHADHVFGLPALLLWMRESGRREPFALVSSPQVFRHVEQVVELAYSGLWGSLPYPIEHRALTPDERVFVGPLELSAASSAHSADNLALRVQDGGFSLCYSGDGKMTAETAELYGGADLLVHECYALEPGARGHEDFHSLISRVSKLSVSDLCIVHLGVDDKESIRRAASSLGGSFELKVPLPGESVQL